MSVGHIARALEEKGMPTVIVAAESFAPRMRMMSLPRVVLTNNLLGRVLGNPGQSDHHNGILLEALEVLRHSEKNGTIRHLH